MIKKAIKTITLSAAMITMMSVFGHTTKVDAANITGTVTATSLNVRSGASTSYSIVGKVTKGEETAESKTEFTLTIPGIHETAGENTKPTVVPELAEWHGKAGDFKVTSNTRLVIDTNAKDIATKLKQHKHSK